MDWKRIAKYATLLLATGLVIGFFENGHLLAGYIAHLVAFTAIFALMAFRQYNRPFLHAVLAILISESAATVLLALIPDALSQLSPLLLLEVAITVIALIAGTSFGAFARRNRPADPAVGSSP